MDLTARSTMGCGGRHGPAPDPQIPSSLLEFRCGTRVEKSASISSAPRAGVDRRGESSLAEHVSFLEFVYQNGRFARHSVPVDSLGELAALQKLIREVARQIYLQENENRDRVPRGFPEAATLYLAASEPNCYTAILEQDPSAEAFHLFFDRARDISISALQAVHKGDALPAAFPNEASRFLLDLGKRLRGDEYIDLRVGDGAASRVATINHRTRAELAKQINVPVVTLLSVEGETVTLEPDAFFLRADDGQKFEVPYGDEERKVVDYAWTNRPRSRVRVIGLQTQRKFLLAEEIDVVDHPRAAEMTHLWGRVDAIARLEAGWLSGHGAKPTNTAVEKARCVLARVLHESAHLPRPGVFPTPDGGVQAEWTFGRWMAEVVFPPTSGALIEADASDTKTGEASERMFRTDEVALDNAIALTNWLEEIRGKENVENGDT